MSDVPRWRRIVGTILLVVGCVLVPTLLDAGYHVTLLDRFPDGDGVLAHCCRFDGFTPVKGDVRDESLLKKLLAQADIVIPLAALVGAPLCKQDPFNATSVNRDAVVKLVDLVGRDQRLVFGGRASFKGAHDGRDDGGDRCQSSRAFQTRGERAVVGPD